MAKQADLHIHTYYSDSTLSPQEVVEKACQNGLCCIAVTDHDTIEGISPVIKAAEGHSLEVVPGVELSSEINGKEVHILGYFINCNDSYLVEKFTCMQDTRVSRMEKMIKKLKELGIDNIELKEVAALVESNSLGRPHLAIMLVKKGWVPNVKKAFDKFLADGGPVYVPKFQQTPSEAIELINESGGVAVLAHPMVSNVDELIPGLVKAGLGGIEACYPNAPDSVINFYKGLAQKHGLVITGGSDAHGKAKTNTFIGKIKIPYSFVEKLKERAGVE